jgi:hypothetical protein
MLNSILLKLQASEKSVDVVPSFAMFERTLDRMDSDLASTLFSFKEEILKRIENHEPNDDNVAGKPQ